VAEIGIDLRPATTDDVEWIADLETARAPDEPVDGATVAFWWAHDPDSARAQRLIGPNLYFTARHGEWKAGERRFGWVGALVHPSAWSGHVFRHGISLGVTWLQAEGAETAASRIREDFAQEIAVLLDLGYREVRRHRHWELDLVARRDQLLQAAEHSRTEMRRQGILVTTLDRDSDPEVLRKIYALDLESTHDIPTTVPIHDPTFDEWQRLYFANPGTRKDRFWIAKIGDEVVGMSLIEFPTGRGIPSTEYTGTLPRFRGRGVARALKYETVAQAIAVGATRVRTDNDSENAPILHLNEEMGYRPTTPYLELHKELTQG